MSASKHIEDGGFAKVSVLGEDQIKTTVTL